MYSICTDFDMIFGFGNGFVRIFQKIDKVTNRNSTEFVMNNFYWNIIKLWWQWLQFDMFLLNIWWNNKCDGKGNQIITMNEYSLIYLVCRESLEQICAWIFDNRMKKKTVWKIAR